MKQKIGFKNNKYYWTVNIICLVLLIAASVYILLHLGGSSGLGLLLIFMWAVWIGITAFELFWPFESNAVKRLTEKDKEKFERYLRNLLSSMKLVWTLLFSSIPYYIVNSVKYPEWSLLLFFVLGGAAMAIWGTKAALLLDMRNK